MNKKLKELRKEKGVSQRVVAEAIGVSTAAYANYEHGTREPSYEVLIKLCKFFNVTADFLVGLE